MAEVLGVVSSAVAVIQIASGVIKLCKLYIKNVKDAPHDLRLILVEITGLKAMLETVQFLVNTDGNSSSNLMKSLGSQDGTLSTCKQLLEDLQKLFPDTSLPRNGMEPPSKRRKSEKVKDAWTALAWPLKVSKCKKLLEEIQRQKSTINLAISAESRYVDPPLHFTLASGSRSVKCFVPILTLSRSQDLKTVKNTLMDVESNLSGTQGLFCIFLHLWPSSCLQQHDSHIRDGCLIQHSWPNWSSMAN
jgi:hypothetical protein